MSDPVSPQEKIILATITCIEKSGLQSLTNRDIAREAGVNSAAINYYFGSKDKLIEAVMHTTLNEALSLWDESREQAGGDPEQTIRLYLLSLLDGSIHYPGLTRAHLLSEFFYPKFKSPLKKVFLDNMPEFYGMLSGICGVSSEEEGRALALNLLSTVILCSLLPGFYSGALGADFNDASVRSRYLDLILSRFIKK